MVARHPVTVLESGSNPARIVEYSVNSSILIRFYQKVEIDSTGCWQWTGALNNKGYGRFKIEGKLVSPHRFSYYVHVGGLLDGVDVCHRCDNPKCVRPSHLFQGSRSDNMKDCLEKGRIVIPDPAIFDKIDFPKVLFAINKSGSLRGAAKLLGCGYKAVKTCIERNGFKLSYENGKPSRII